MPGEGGSGRYEEFQAEQQAEAQRRAALTPWERLLEDSWESGMGSTGNRAASVASQLRKIDPNRDWTPYIQQVVNQSRAQHGSGFTEWSSNKAIANQIASSAGLQAPYSQDELQAEHDQLVQAHAAAQKDDDFLGTGIPMDMLKYSIPMALAAWGGGNLASLFGSEAAAAPLGYTAEEAYLAGLGPNFGAGAAATGAGGTAGVGAVG